MEFTFIDTCSVTRFGVQTCCNVTVELGEVAIFRNHCKKQDKLFRIKIILNIMKSSINAELDRKN